jgi:hypothetical protein
VGLVDIFSMINSSGGGSTFGVSGTCGFFAGTEHQKLQESKMADITELQQPTPSTANRHSFAE